MAMSKEETTALVIGVLVVLGGGAAFAASSNKQKVAPGASPPKPPKSPKDDGDALVKRANQKSALAWAGVFLDHPTTPLVAAALARWAGIESSGDPMSKSRLNERGLMQVGPHAVAEHELSQDSWDALLDPKASKKVQADIAVAYVDALAHKAAAHLSAAPVDPVDAVWFAKLYHQRPVDLRDVVGPLSKQLSTTSAHTLAATLAHTWADNPAAMHRLRAANVVAWGTATP